MNVDIVVPILVLLAGAAYVFLPFWGESSPLRMRRRATVGPRSSLEQLELDRELGKIDEAEYQSLRPELESRSLPEEFDLESLIFALRRGKRLELALEAEIAIARQKSKNNLN